MIAPLEGVGPDDFRVRELLDRVRQEGVTGSDPGPQPLSGGETTTTYLAQELRPLGLKVTRIAYGLPMGGEIKYADQQTLKGVLEPPGGDVGSSQWSVVRENCDCIMKKDILKSQGADSLSQREDRRVLPAASHQKIGDFRVGSCVQISELTVISMCWWNLNRGMSPGLAFFSMQDQLSEHSGPQGGSEYFRNV